MERCPRCFLAGDAMATCIEKAPPGLGCPRPIEVVPGKDIVLMCRKEDCGKVVAMSAVRAAHHGERIPQCRFSEAECQLVALSKLPK